MRRLIVAVASVIGVACASAGAPPGGPEDHQPPQIVKVSPDSGETNAKVKSVEFRFDEVVSDRPSAAGATVSALFLVSPRNGATQASWHRHRITVRPSKGFRDNTAYKITLLPGLADLRGNIRKEQTTVVFSTGPFFPQFSILGRVFDWTAQRPAPNAYVEAMSRNDTSIVYLASADTSGAFDVGPLPNGTYVVRAIIDQNKNRVLDRNEKWDSTVVTIESTRPSIELDAIERDTTPPLIDNVTVIDSVTVRVTFDKALDPAMPLQPALLRIQRADSSEVEIARVEWQTPFERSRAARDSALRADSLRANPPAAAPGAPPAAPPAQPPPSAVAPGGARPAPPPPKPSRPPPERGIVATISPASPFVPGASYRITTRGIRNLLGRSREASRAFTVPQPPPPRPPADSTRRPPPDSARRPPPNRSPR